MRGREAVIGKQDRMRACAVSKDKARDSRRKMITSLFAECKKEHERLYAFRTIKKGCWTSNRGCAHAGYVAEESHEVANTRRDSLANRSKGTKETA
jgi:hypothetical protein